MKLNVGDLVELLYDGTTFSGVITAVTPERVELAFTLNIFVEGPGKVTWPNGADLDVDVGANALTKLHLRLPLEDVARILTLEPATPPEPPKARQPTRKARTKDLLEEAAQAVAAPPPAPAPEIDLENLLASGPDAPAAPEPEPQPAPAPEPAVHAARPREGIWVAYEAQADGQLLSSGDLFPASLLAVSSTGCVVRAELALAEGDRIQLKFKLGKDAFDLAASVINQDAPEVFEIAYDTLPSEVRVRMLRSVLGLAKPELRTQESWTYQLRQKGGA